MTDLAEVSKEEKDLLQTFGDMLHIVDSYIVLDNKRRSGEISAEDFAEQLANFMLPVAYEAMLLLGATGGMLSPYIENAEKTFNELRSVLLGSHDETPNEN